MCVSFQKMLDFCRSITLITILFLNFCLFHFFKISYQSPCEVQYVTKIFDLQIFDNETTTFLKFLKFAWTCLSLLYFF